jgi:hypothetical protein
MKKVKFITAIYSDLNGTEFGGRPSRGGHYRWSLLSLLKMTDADFLCYTSDRELDSLKDFFYVQNNVSQEQLKFQTFDISETKFVESIKMYKNIEESKRSDRCIEIQYSKFHWWWDEDKSYEYYYWIDAGLSHCGLIPDKYLTHSVPMRSYYESSLFNNNFLKKLMSISTEKFFLIAKENQRHFWSGTVNAKWYTNYDNSLHIIGGMFGGKKELWDNVVTLFETYLKNILDTDKSLYMEEVIMSLMFFNHKDLFVYEQFDSWWHENERIPGIDDMPKYLEDKKSFYKILEDLNKNYE